MPQVTIDGNEIEVADGTTVLQAAEELGIFIPHYCYHGGLSISGNCRMCLVEVEKMPKLTTACTQPVGDGMVVFTTSEKVRRGQEDVMEYLLKNHPLDCPVCDQAGECLLQDFYMAYDGQDSRLRETKNRKVKAKSVGPRIILDQERCILCTRCVRFLDEVTGTAELCVVGRGSRERLDIFPGREVDNDYDANIVDLCPVGALTDKDFRFKVRSWYLSTRPSLCDGCSTGCSILVDHNDERLYKNEGRRIIRYRAAYEPEVNGHWICNIGRYSYKKHEEDRLLVPRAKPDTAWPASIEGVMGRLAPELGKEAEAASGQCVGVIVAPSVSNEEAYLIKTLFGEGLGTPHIDHRIPGLVAGASPGEEPVDGLLRRTDPWPNSRGLHQLGLVPGSGGYDVEAMLEAAVGGKLAYLFIIGADLTQSDLDQDRVRDALSRTTSVAMLTHRSDMNDLVEVALPMATHVERDGTFTNFDDRVQRFHRVVPPMGEAEPLYRMLGRLAEGLGIELPAVEPPDVFEILARDQEPMKGLSWPELARREAETVGDAHNQWINSLTTPQL